MGKYPTEKPLPPVVDTAQVARHLGLHVETIYGLIARGDLRATKIGRRWRIRREDIEEHPRFAFGVERHAAPPLNSPLMVPVGSARWPVPPLNL
jgi:excisionase family DNA binding protein